MPAQTLEIPKRLPLVAEPENRLHSPDKDARLINSYLEKDKRGEYWWNKRAGLFTFLTKSGNGYGLYNWLGDVYEIFGTTIYKNGTSIGTVDGTGGVYRFSSTLGGTPRLVLGNGVKAYTYDGTTFAQITDANFPTSFVKGWAYLDGTTYVMDANANIYGSDLNDPTTWNALNVIIAQIEPDKGVALAKQLVYVIAFKQWSTEVFYDAANSTGSPLGTVQGAKANFGCISQDTVQSIDDILLWVSTNRSAAPAVMMMDNLKVTKVSTAPVDRLLEEADFTNCYSWQYKDAGHRFYGVTIVNSNITLVYDMTENLWAQWYDTNGDYWPISAMSYAGTTRYAQHATNGKVYEMARNWTTDDGGLFDVDLYTPIFDGNIDRRKVCNFLHMEGDKTPGSIIQLRVSDDDYNTWSQYRSFDMSQDRPFLTQLGTFYRRVHNFHHRCATTMRARAGDWQLDIGTL